MNGEKRLSDQRGESKEYKEEQGSKEEFPSIVVSVYDNFDGYENRLNFWLKLEHWTLQEAAALIADIDPESIELTPDQQCFANARTLREPELYPEEEEEEEDEDEDEDRVGVDSNGNLVTNDPHVQEARLKFLYRKIKDTERILGGIHPKKEVATPAEWINTALARGIEVPWLQWAKRVRLPPTHISQAEKPLGEKERLSMLKIIAAFSEMEKLDKNMDFKNAKVIQNQCILMGLEISENTIVKYLKEARALISKNSRASTNNLRMIRNT